jgi:Bacterial PH domain/Domain of unknown function (DUF1648)
MTFKPLSCSDRWHGVLAVLGLILVDAVMVLVILRRPVDGLSFLLALWVLASLLIIVYVGYRIVGAFTLEYWVDRDAVTLVWGPTRQTIPLGQIQRVMVGSGSSQVLRAQPWHWPCPDRRRAVCDDLGVVNSYATRSLGQQLVLVTANESFGVSPADPGGFMSALQERFALGVGRPLPAELRRPPVWTWPLWRDRIALVLIGAGLLGVLLMFGALCFRFPALSSDLPLHFDASGIPDRIVPKSGLFVLPIIGLIAWVFNLVVGIWLYRWVQQGAAYLLWGGALVVQLIAGLALFNLMRW